MLADAADARLSQGLIVVQEVSRRIARRLGGQIPLDDLVGIGNLALVDVLRDHDASRASFASYATARLKQAIIDGLRRETHGRTIASRVAALMASERLAEAQAEASAEPTASIEEDQSALARLLGGHAAALAVGLLTTPPDPQVVETPEEAVQWAEGAHVVKGAIAALPERERALMERYYYGGEGLESIADDLGITKSWASRLHKQAVLTLTRAVQGGGVAAQGPLAAG